MRHLLAAFCLVIAACGGDAPSNPGDTPDLTTSTTPDLALPPGSDVCDPMTPRSVVEKVFATPDAGEQPYLEVLTTAQSSVKVLIYLMGYGGILDTLVAKAKAGIKVSVILDVGQTANQKYADMLTAAGAEVHWSDPVFPYMHAKTLIVDDRAAVSSTGNYSKSLSILKERNFVAQINDLNDVADLVELFQADWEKRAPNLGCTRLLVSPLNSRERVLNLIDSAQHTLVMETMQFADDDVRAHVQARKTAGVDVRVLLAAPSWITANTEASMFLKNLGIATRWMSTPGVHVKAFVVDGQTAYMGSENFSYTSLSKNREVGIIALDGAAVQTISKTFEADWATATPF